jgi:hypothetical protein
MKVFIILTSALLILFLVFQAYTVMATKKTKEQPYSLIKKEKEFEIRFYPSVPIARISSTKTSFKELGSEGFRKLASYIFGGNEENKSIAMTSPVSMSIEGTSSSMFFVMPSGFNLDNLPKPNDKDVMLTMSNEEYVAVISFGGFASDQDIQFYTEALKKLLKENKINSIGRFRYLGYNPPYQLFDRKNEIVVRIEWNNS